MNKGFSHALMLQTIKTNFKSGLGFALQLLEIIPTQHTNISLLSN
jgi:hypothetical protein